MSGDDPKNADGKVKPSEQPGGITKKNDAEQNQPGAVSEKNSLERVAFFAEESLRMAIATVPAVICTALKDVMPSVVKSMADSTEKLLGKNKLFQSSLDLKELDTPSIYGVIAGVTFTYGLVLLMFSTSLALVGANLLAGSSIYLIGTLLTYAGSNLALLWQRRAKSRKNLANHTDPETKESEKLTSGAQLSSKIMLTKKNAAELAAPNAKDVKRANKLDASLSAPRPKINKTKPKNGKGVIAKNRAKPQLTDGAEALDLMLQESNSSPQPAANKKRIRSSARHAPPKTVKGAGMLDHRQGKSLTINSSF